MFQVVTTPSLLAKPAPAVSFEKTVTKLSEMITNETEVNYGLAIRRFDNVQVVAIPYSPSS